MWKNTKQIIYLVFAILALELLWPLSVSAELVGHLNDVVGSNHGTSVNGATVGTDNGLIGGAASFDGVDDAIYVSSSALTGTQWSLAWWDKNPGTEPRAGYMVASGDPLGYEVLLCSLANDHERYYGGITMGLELDRFNGDGLSNGIYPRGQWHHHVVVNDGAGTAKWYIDGGAEVMPETNVFTAFDSRLYIGNRKALDRPYIGLIDDLRFYNHVLSEEEVTELFLATPHPLNGEVNVSPGVILTWPASANAVSYNVYFGAATGSLVQVTAEQSETTYDPPGLLDFHTAYNWRVDEVDASGQVWPGHLWTFTTGELSLDVLS